MPRQESSRLKLSYGWLRGEDWWGDPVSANFVKIDMLLNPVIISMSEGAPPQTGNKVGDMYIVATGAYGDWATHDGALAVLSPKGWIFAMPTEGVRARLKNPEGWIWFNGTEWIGEDKNSGAEPVPLGSRYDVAVSVSFEPEPEEYLALVAIPEAMTLPAGAPESTARAVVPPVGLVRFEIYRNAAIVGRITFTPSNVKGTVDVTQNVVYAAGDLFAIRVPDNPPAGFENYAATIRMLLNRNGAST
jgi:hypothetical protein